MIVRKKTLRRKLAHRGFVLVENYGQGFCSTCRADSSNVVLLPDLPIYLWPMIWLLLKFEFKNTLKPKSMEYTYEQLRQYLSQEYTLGSRQNGHDKYYNFQTRSYIPLQLGKEKFTEVEVIEMFGNNAKHPPYIEIVRFKNFITNQKITIS